MITLRGREDFAKNGVLFVQKMNTQKALKWVGIIASTLWIIVSIYTAFFDVDPDQFGFKSPEVEARMQNCGGSFKQRYECKEAAILAKHRQSFVLWIEKVAAILGPPLALAFLIRLANRQAPKEEEDDLYGRRPPPVKKRRVR
ncbi:MAG TPA: hypothetical protein HPP80_05350 [Rhodospirillaceae bacterium]|nr:hypothetical protein [Rhodospirillaceae bacterium]